MSKSPTTIEELKQWYEAHHLPPEQVTRFFIDKDIKEPKAFGIYKNEEGECVVYKNKASGERAIRYKGTDEAFAVGEFFQRLRVEISKQKANSRSANAAMLSSGKTPSKSGMNMTSGTKKKGCLAVIGVAVVGFLMMLFGNNVPNGYYHYHDNYYYRQGSSWYIYNALANDWLQTSSLDDEINKDNADQYHIDRFSGKQFEDTEWYSTSSDSDWDDDSDDYWDDDDDSWDSDDTDWDSDW